MKTEVYEADPFTNARRTRWLTFESNYRFEPREEFFLTTEAGDRFKVRVTHVYLEVTAARISRELIVMKL